MKTIVSYKLVTLQILLYSFIGTITLLTLYWFCQLYTINDYDKFVHFLKAIFQGSFLVEDLERNFISNDHFIQIQSLKSYLLIGVIVIITLSIFLTQNNLNKIPNKVLEITPSYSNKSKLILIGIILIIVAYKVFLFFYLPAHMDEMFDFVFYAKSNILTRHTYVFNDGNQWYNNHLLYSDFSNIFFKLGLPQKLAMRLPSILGELLLTIFIWFRFKKQETLKSHFIIIILASSFWLSIYSIEARSYYLVSVCTIISFFLINDLLERPNKEQFLLFILVSLIGLSLIHI